MSFRKPTANRKLERLRERRERERLEDNIEIVVVKHICVLYLHALSFYLCIYMSIEVSVQVQVPATSPPGKEPPLPIG
jgi:hypothetical protein